MEFLVILGILKEIFLFTWNYRTYVYSDFVMVCPVYFDVTFKVRRLRFKVFPVKGECVLWLIVTIKTKITNVSWKRNITHFERCWDSLCPVYNIIGVKCSHPLSLIFFSSPDTFFHRWTLSWLHVEKPGVAPEEVWSVVSEGKGFSFFEERVLNDVTRTVVVPTLSWPPFSTSDGFYLKIVWK